MDNRLKLDLDASLDATTAAKPRDAATILFVRDGEKGVEIFCVERAKGSRFLGGAIVFPGGAVDEEDHNGDWEGFTSGARFGRLEAEPAMGRALGIAACREALEEARLLPTLDANTRASRPLEDARLDSLRAVGSAELREVLRRENLLLDLDALVPFARWVTPIAEKRRFDARFLVDRAPLGQTGAHDESETTRSFWATPHDVLARFAANEIQLAPPTHRTLEILATAASVDEILGAQYYLGVICPELRPHVDVKGETMALTIPGDPEHSSPEALLPGSSRYVLRDGSWFAENAPKK